MEPMMSGPGPIGTTGGWSTPTTGGDYSPQPAQPQGRMGFFRGEGGGRGGFGRMRGMNPNPFGMGGMMGYGMPFGMMGGYGNYGGMGDMGYGMPQMGYGGFGPFAMMGGYGGMGGLGMGGYGMNPFAMQGYDRSMGGQQYRDPYSRGFDMGPRPPQNLDEMMPSGFTRAQENAGYKRLPDGTILMPGI